MGKRDKRVVCTPYKNEYGDFLHEAVLLCSPQAFVNPIAAARARGPAPVSGPTIKDYLGRNRMSL